MAPFYLKRYQLFADAVVATAAGGGKSVDAAAYAEQLAALASSFQLDQHWTNQSATTEPADPVGDPVAVGRELWRKYAPANRGVTW